MHEGLSPADELPWTISYVIRKRAQIDSFNELPAEKRPTDALIWYGTPKDIDRWFKKVLKYKDENPDKFILEISEDEIE